MIWAYYVLKSLSYSDIDKNLYSSARKGGESILIG